jgi:filamentous hemagglutinin
MFANKIWLVGNEHGVGVRNAGSIGAQAGELVVTVDGRLENTGALQSRQNVRVQASGDLANAGTIAASREVAITTGGTLDNSGGKLNAQRLQVEAQGLRNQGGAIEQTGVQALALKAEAASNRSNGLLGALDAVASGGNGGGPGRHVAGQWRNAGNRHPARGRRYRRRLDRHADLASGADGRGPDRHRRHAGQ